MLQILHPELMPLIRDYPGGLLTLQAEGEDRLLLVVKTTKEMLLTSKEQKGFKIYVAPVSFEGKPCIGLVSAFFDDPDEPLCIFTPCFSEAYCEYATLFSSKDIQVHLFDEHARQLLAYEASISMPEKAADRLRQAAPPAFSLAAAKSMHEEMALWFSIRTADDDKEAISVSFTNPLMPEEVVIMDLERASYSFNGAKGYGITFLKRVDEPGIFQEPDIVRLLQRMFSPDDIFLNPLRTYDKEEVCDILVVTENVVMIVQAKDSPNTDKSLARTIARKRKTIHGHLKDALGQVKGAVGYINKSNPFEFLMKDRGGFKSFSFDMQNRQLLSLVVVKELFNDEYAEYSKPVLALMNEVKVPCVPLGYDELHMYASHLADEDAFLEAYFSVVHFAIDNGQIPRLRFGLVDGND